MRAELTSGLAFEEKWKTQLYCHLRETYCLPATTMVSSLQLAYKPKSCWQLSCTFFFISFFFCTSPPLSDHVQLLYLASVQLELAGVEDANGHVLNETRLKRRLQQLRGAAVGTQSNPERSCHLLDLSEEQLGAAEGVLAASSSQASYLCECVCV